MDTSDFLSLKLTDPGIDGLIGWLVQPDPAVVTPRAATYLNAHTVNLALRRESTLKSLMDRMDLIYPDGMSVVREARRRRFNVSQRVSAADFFPQFCQAAAQANRRMALVGAKRDTVEACALSLERQVPGLKVSYRHDGFFRDEDAILRELAQVRPDITLVGMGSPRQEAFALRLRDELRLPTTWCVGALFEYYAPGVRRRAPQWMRENGLEWLFRLAQEPRRLAGRYLIGNIEFLLRARGII